MRENFDSRGRFNWDHVSPLTYCRPADSQDARNGCLIPKMTDDSISTHRQMLTVVSDDLQPQFANGSLTLVYMTKLADRLKEAMGTGISRSDLAKAIKAANGSISRAGMVKWFDGSAKDLTARNAFAVAKRCGVDAEWLATGIGAARPMKHVVREDAPVYGLPISAEEAAVGREWGKLDDPQRSVIALQIELLVAAQKREGRKSSKNDKPTKRDRPNTGASDATDG